jgi:O-antigen biosynthesis protein
MNRPKVELILVKYNCPEMEDSTVSHAVATAGHPNYSLRAHQNERGVPLSRVWNRLIRESDAEFVCLLNTDTIPTDGWMNKLAETLEMNPAVAAVVPSSNRVHVSQVEAPFEDWETSVYKIEYFAKHLREQYESDPFLQITTGSAMCLMLRKSAFEAAGGFDEEYLFYGEDTDLLYRLSAEHGMMVVWRRDVYIHHHGSQSFIKAANDKELDYRKLRSDAANLWANKKSEIDARIARAKHA